MLFIWVWVFENTFLEGSKSKDLSENGRLWQFLSSDLGNKNHMDTPVAIIVCHLQPYTTVLLHV